MNVTTNELIPISDNNGKRAVNARDLHAFLESKRDFSTWIKDRIKSYDFIEGVDFQSFTEIVEREIGATKRIEYALSISMAKELSMIENNERGRQARKYFIACEENKHELSRKELALRIKREFPCLQAGDNSAFVHTFFWLKSPTHGAWESKACGLS